MKNKQLVVDNETHALVKALSFKLDRPLRNTTKRVLEAGIKHIMKHGDVTSASDIVRTDEDQGANGIADI